MSERLNKVHLVISSIAATVIAIGFIVIHVHGETHGLLLFAMWVSVAIILFYFIGHLARAFLVTKVFPLPEESVCEELFEEGELEEEIMVSVDMEMPEDTMMHAPEHEGLDENGENGMIDEGELEEVQPDYD